MAWYLVKQRDNFCPAPGIYNISKDCKPTPS